MAPRYLILEGTAARARFFKTQARAEFQFLQFASNLKHLSNNLDQYISISSLCGEQAAFVFCLHILRDWC
jgi:hypothetical protein